MNVGQFRNILIYISLPFQCTETSSLVYQGGPCVFHRVIEHNWYEKSSLIINDFVKLATSLKLEEQRLIHHPSHLLVTSHVLLTKKMGSLLRKSDTKKMAGEMDGL